MSDTPFMETQSGRPKPTPLRASDAERERVAALLRESTAEGRITLEELSERVELAYAARTRPELDAVVEDLPGRDAVPRDTGRPRAARWTVAVIGNEARGGRWRPGEDTRALALIGDCTLDLRQAEVEGGELAVTAIALLGDVRVVVPPGVAVDLEGVALVGSKKYRLGEGPEPPAGAPHVRVRAYAVVGDVTVMSEPPVSRLDNLRTALERLRNPGDRGSSPPGEDADRRA
jgi:Domain of unknown function (DUF1707)/Cell wall-active antibiotics response 4TMS YvqF